MKHAATPWKLEYIGKTVRVVTDAGGVDYGDDVAVLPNTEQCAVDAAFIVRACNAHDALLEALQEAIAVIKVIKPPENGNGTIVIGEAAIRKATGEQQ